MRLTILIIAAFVGFAQAGMALAQATDNTPPEQGATCPPDAKGEPPTVGGGSSGPLSDKLAQSKGVICPPAGIDRDMQVTPPGGGHLNPDQLAWPGIATLPGLPSTAIPTGFAPDGLPVGVQIVGPWLEDRRR